MQRIKDVLKKEVNNLTKTNGNDIDSVETIGEPYKKGFVIKINFKDGHYLMATDPAIVNTGTKEPEPEEKPEPPTRKRPGR